jgi:hypothetical protein
MPLPAPLLLCMEAVAYTAWHGDLVFLFDMDCGIEVLRLKGGPHGSARLATVSEPRARRDRLAAVPVRTGDSFVCPLFTAPSS